MPNARGCVVSEVQPTLSDSADSSPWVLQLINHTSTVSDMMKASESEQSMVKMLSLLCLSRHENSTESDLVLPTGRLNDSRARIVRIEFCGVCLFWIILFLISITTV